MNEEFDVVDYMFVLFLNIYLLSENCEEFYEKFEEIIYNFEWFWWDLEGDDCDDLSWKKYFDNWHTRENRYVHILDRNWSFEILRI